MHLVEEPLTSLCHLHCVCVCVWPRFFLSDKQCTIQLENKYNKSYKRYAAAATNCYRKDVQRLNFMKPHTQEII